MLKKKPFLLYSIAIALMTSFLTGCFHDNPLDNSNKQETASFLVDASKYAEHKLKLSTEGEDGYIYRDCMDHQSKYKYCKSLYGLMVDYAKNHKIFPNVTITDLKNQKIWKGVREEYEIKRFNSV